jgi:HAD superfamily hydrolase (TIGR01509 family)
LEDYFGQFGIVGDAKLHEAISGRTWTYSFDVIFDRFPVPVSRAEAEAEVLERYRKATENQLIIVPGVIDAVKDFARHFPMAVVSGSFRNQIKFALDKTGLRDSFEFYLGAEDYPRSKPAPDGYETAMKRFGVQGNSVLIFEDSVAGITSGKAAGARVVAVECANHFKELQKAADFSIPDFRGIDSRWVKSLGQKSK